MAILASTHVRQFGMIIAAVCGISTETRNLLTSDCIFRRVHHPRCSGASNPVRAGRQTDQYHRICAGDLFAKVFGRKADVTNSLFPSLSASTHLLQTSRQHLLVTHLPPNTSRLTDHRSRRILDFDCVGGIQPAKVWMGRSSCQHSRASACTKECNASKPCPQLSYLNSICSTQYRS